MSLDRKVYVDASQSKKIEVEKSNGFTQTGYRLF